MFVPGKWPTGRCFPTSISAGVDPAKPQTIVAVADGLIRGFATMAPSHDPETAKEGELVALYVDPESWGCGIGRAIVSAARARLVAAGFRCAVL